MCDWCVEYCEGMKTPTAAGLHARNSHARNTMPTLNFYAEQEHYLVCNAANLCKASRFMALAHARQRFLRMVSGGRRAERQIEIVHTRACARPTNTCARRTLERV